jgi:DNA-binding NtrC family response regulator
VFGYVQGAFTGADSNKNGHFAAAEGGTLFFDEVGEIPLTHQVDLLRVLEEKAYRPVGSTQNVKMNVRTIFATNRNLELEVSEGRFREDLYYRLNVVPIRLPHLRDRHEDIPLLVETFLDQLCALHHKFRKQLDADAMQQMLTYEWPGNVRELKNTIERLVVTCPDNDVKFSQLPSRIRAAIEEPKTVALKAGMSLEAAERILISDTLQNITSNRKEAAQLLGISLRALQYKIKKYDLR